MSDDTIEIYVRHSGGKNLLNVYASDDAKKAAAQAHSRGLPTAFVELSVLPEWITDETQRAAYEAGGEVLHLRIPISGDLPFRSTSSSGHPQLLGGMLSTG